MVYGRKPAFGRTQNNEAASTNTGVQETHNNDKQDDADGTQFVATQPPSNAAPVQQPAAPTPISSAPAKPRAAFGRAPKPATSTTSSDTPRNESPSEPKASASISPAMSRLIEIVGERIGATFDEIMEMKKKAITDPEGMKACYSAIIPQAEQAAFTKPADGKDIHFNYDNGEAECVMSVPANSPYAERFKGAVIKSSKPFSEETRSCFPISAIKPAAKKIKP